MLILQEIKSLYEARAVLAHLTSLCSQHTVCAQMPVLTAESELNRMKLQAPYKPKRAPLNV